MSSLIDFSKKHGIGFIPSEYREHKVTFADVVDCLRLKETLFCSASILAGYVMAGGIGAAVGFSGSVGYVLLDLKRHITGWMFAPIEEEKEEVASEEVIEDEAPPIIQDLYSATLQEALDANGIPATVVGYNAKSPRLIMYVLEVKKGFDINKVSTLGKNFIRDMGLQSDAILTVEPNIGDGKAGIYLPKSTQESVLTNELIKAIPKNKYKLPCLVGADIHGDLLAFDLVESKHLIIAGQTGAGKSIQLGNIILSLASSNDPRSLQMTMIDPKIVELALYEKLPQLTQPPITDMVQAVEVLEHLVSKMVERYELLKASKARNIEDYLARGKTMPYHVIVVDEVADLVSDTRRAYDDPTNKTTIGDAAEQAMVKLAAQGRACGFYLLLATQRFDAKTFSGLLRTNIPSAIGLSVKKATESVMVIEQTGCESLLGKGDCYVSLTGKPPIRAQSAYSDEADVERLVNEIVSKECSNENTATAN